MIDHFGLGKYSHSELLDRIDSYLRLNSSFDKNIGFFDGRVGALVFFSCMANTDYRVDILFDLSQEIANSIGYDTPTEYGIGVSGFAAALELFNREQILDIDVNYIFSDVEPTILNIIHSGKCNRLDLQQGLAGYGLYLIFRLRSNSPMLDMHRFRLTECLISIIYQTKRLFENGIALSDKLDLETGWVGICLFLRNAVSMNLVSGVPDDLLVKISESLIRLLQDREFSIDDFDAWFVLVFCSGSIHNEIGFLRYLDKFVDSRNEVPVIDLLRSVVFLKVLEKRRTVARLDKAIEPLVEYLNGRLAGFVLSDEYLSHPCGRAMSGGLFGGFPGFGLFLFSLELSDFRWMELIGVEI